MKYRFSFMLITLFLSMLLPLSAQDANMLQRVKKITTGNISNAAITLDFDNDNLIINSIEPYKNQSVNPEIPETEGWEAIKVETFEGPFPNAWSIDYDGWGKSSYRSHDGGYSCWNANYNNSGSHAYANDMFTWMVYGPINLEQATGAEMNYYHWTNTEEGFDYMFAGASIDGGNYYGNLFTGALSTGDNDWNFFNLDMTNVYTLGNITGQSQVWIAFVFESDELYTYEGSYVDDITIRRFIDADQPALDITSPDGGELWMAGLNHDIRWTSENIDPGDDLRLEYTTDNGDTWNVINATTSNDGYYSWPVPSIDSDQCRVKISTLDDAAVNMSDNPFVITTVPRLIVSTPDGGETWEGGTTHDIIWQSVGAGEQVKIELSLNNGANWSAISTETENDGTFEWTLPYFNSEQCLIRISDTKGSPAGTSPDVFTIHSPHITITKPNGGEHWQPGESERINWSSEGTSGIVDIYFSSDNGESWNVVLDDITDDGSKSWRVPDVNSASCLIALLDNDGGLPADTSDTTFTIGAPVALTLMSPNGGEEWIAGALQNITWTSIGDISDIKLDFSVDNGISWQPIIATVPNTGSYEWEIPNQPSLQCLVKISDVADTAEDQSDSTFTITTSCPWDYAVTEDFYPVIINDVMIKENKVELGDWIGAFASNGLGGQVCAGAVQVMGEAPWAMQAWGNDSQTNDKDGFDTGEILHYRVWDSSTEEEFGPESLADYSTGDGSWGNGALAVLDLLEFSTTCEMTLNLETGWNWVSGNVIPDTAAMDMIWAGLQDVNMIKGQSGFYIPDVINSIGDWDIFQMYSVNVSAPLQLMVTGECMPVNNPIYLDAGWNWITYLPMDVINAEMALASILDNVQIAKSQNGFLIPGVINSLGDMTPGDGYKVYLAQNDTLVYPELLPPVSTGPVLSKANSYTGSHFTEYSQTDRYQAVLIKDIDRESVKQGMEIGAFTQSGRCLCSVVYTGELPMAMQIWADDPQTELVEGYIAGDQLQFRIWDPESDRESQINYRISNGSQSLGASPYIAVSLDGTTALPATYSLEQNYPNPFNPVTTIAFAIPEQAHVSLTVYNIKGELIKTLVNDNRQAGRYTVSWNATNNDQIPVSSGIYFYRLQTPGVELLKKLTLIK